MSAFGSIVIDRAFEILDIGVEVASVTAMASFVVMIEIPVEDKRKAEIAQRVNTNLNRINQNQTTQMLKHL